MFRHINLIQAIGNENAPFNESAAIGESKGEGGEINRLAEPKQNYPDSEADGLDNATPRYLVWIQGFNVPGQEARAWHSELFKRFYWAGSKARFVGVSWYGFERPQPNYHTNVVNAFETAKIFGLKLKPIVGEFPVTVMAHSLGNMVVSSYLHDYHQKLPLENQPKIDKYLLIDAAVALEAYLGDYQQYAKGKGTELFGPENEMIYSDWYGYQKRLGASEWYQLFSDSEDHRKELTWRKRFASPTSGGIVYHNFYSTGEDVLANFAGETLTWEQVIQSDFGRNSWVVQEKWKGRAPYGIEGLGGTTTMGWGFNASDYYEYIPQENAIFQDLAQKKANANSIDSKDLINKPFFRMTATSNLSSTLFDESIGGAGSNYARDHRNWLLGYAIPALTFPAGGRNGGMMGTERFIDPGNTINMDSEKNGWPSERERSAWLHSDIKDLAFPFTIKVINELLDRGGLR